MWTEKAEAENAHMSMHPSVLTHTQAHTHLLQQAQVQTDFCNLTRPPTQPDSNLCVHTDPCTHHASKHPASTHWYR